MTKARLDPDGVRKTGLSRSNGWRQQARNGSPKPAPKKSQNGRTPASISSPRGQGETHRSLCPFPSRRDHAPPANPDLPPCQKVGEEARAEGSGCAGRGSRNSPRMAPVRQGCDWRPQRPPKRLAGRLCGGCAGSGPTTRPASKRDRRAEQTPSKYRAELARQGDELAERAAILTSKERDLARRAAVLATIRRQTGLDVPQDLETMARPRRQRPDDEARS